MGRRILDLTACRTKVDEKSCFGMIEWKAVREAASRLLPNHTAAAGWEHRNLSFVEQEEVLPLPKDNGAAQGDVDGPLDLSSGIGGGSGSLPCIGVDDPSEIQRLQAEHAMRMQRISNFQLGGPEQLTGADDPRHALASGNRRTPRQAPAPQRTVVAHSVDNSANYTFSVSHLGSPQPRACNSHANSLDRDLRTAPFSL